MTVEKRREKIPERCGEPHPTLEWFTVDKDTNEYVYYAETCMLSKDHKIPHLCRRTTAGGMYQW